MTADIERCMAAVMEIAEEAEGAGNSMAEGAWLPEQIAIVRALIEQAVEAARKEGIEAAAKIADSMSDSDWSAAQIAEAIRVREG